MGVKTAQAAITHRIAICHECDWRCEDYKTAMEDARDHTRFTRHSTTVETARFNRYVYEHPAQEGGKG